MDEEYQRMAAHAIAHEAFCAGQAWQQAAAAHERPCVLWKPRLFIDGNQWCALFGENIQEGVAGFGDSPDEAMWAFDTAWRKKLSPLPGAQPAPSFADAYQGAMEEVAIWKKRALEAEDLNRKFIAEINGPMLTGEPVAQPAPSVPDLNLSDPAVQKRLAAQWGYVPAEAQPAPSVPDGFSREDLEAVADGLDGYEKTVNVGNVTGGGDDHLESTTAYAARFIRAMLAAAPEAKP